MTKTEKVVKYLLDKGLVEVESKSRKYRTFEKSGSKNLYFVGKRAAVRTGKCISKSFSITNVVHKRIK